MKKKVLALVLMAAMTAASVMGCAVAAPAASGGAGSAEPAEAVEAEAATATADEGDAVTLNVYLMSSSITDDVEKVEKALSDYVRPLINANVDLTFINSGSYQDTVSQMVRAGDKDLDICFLSEVNLRTAIAQEAVAPMSELLEKYGDGIVDAVGEQFIQAAYINGEIYCIPSLKDMAQSRMLIYRKDMAEEAGVLEDLEDGKSMNLEDLTPIFAKVKEAYPDYDMFGGCPNAQSFGGWNWDNLSDSLGVLMDYAQDPTVVDVFESDYYMNLCKTMREWYTNGYIDKDIATGTDFWNARIKAGNTFSGITSYKPGNVETCEIQVGYDLGYVIITDALRCTSNVMNATLCIPEASPNKEKAMQLLQLWYTDPAVGNFIINGIEGENYEYKEDGSIGFITTQEESGYYNYGMGWTYGNQFITPVWTGTALDVWDQTRAFNESAKCSVAFGFAWNNEDYVNEVAACTNVLTKYRADLETGTIDPEENIPKFVQELKDNGIDKIIEAKQAQLDAFLGK